MSEELVDLALSKIQDSIDGLRDSTLYAACLGAVSGDSIDEHISNAELLFNAIPDGR